MKYTVKWHLKRDGREYAPGKPVELTDEEAAPLIEAGVIDAPPVKVVKPDGKGARPADPPEA